MKIGDQVYVVSTIWSSATKVKVYIDRLYVVSVDNSRACLADFRSLGAVLQFRPVEEVFRHESWAQVVRDSTADRLRLEGFTVEVARGIGINGSSEEV